MRQSHYETETWSFSILDSKKSDFQIGWSNQRLTSMTLVIDQQKEEINLSIWITVIIPDTKNTHIKTSSLSSTKLGRQVISHLFLDRHTEHTLGKLLGNAFPIENPIWRSKKKEFEKGLVFI